MILRRRQQLLSWLAENAPTAYMRRAVEEGNVEFLGWFKQILGSVYPGWIVQATCPITNKVWKIIVRRSMVCQDYCVWILFKDIPWRYWNPTDSANPFFYGDNPETYRQNRENAKTQRCREVHQENDES